MESKQPRITSATNDYNDLLLTAILARRRGDPNAAFLLAELMRASLRHPVDLPDDVVSTNCGNALRPGRRAPNISDRSCRFAWV